VHLETFTLPAQTLAFIVIPVNEMILFRNPTFYKFARRVSNLGFS
jgi:hypothetical protein